MPIMAGMMDEMEGMVDCAREVAGDGSVGSVGVVVFGLEDCMMMMVMMMMRMVEAVAMARQ
jgi:hypothetical protein